MNNVMFVSVLAVTVLLTVTGCGKKKETQMSLDANAVVSENVVSITDNALPATMDIPVVVENGVTSQLTENLGEPSTGIVSDKPSPKNIQKALKNAGLYTGKVDGNIGPKTKKSIEAFQSQHGLKADGKVGPKTWKALSKYLTQSAEVENPSAQEQAFPTNQ